MNYIKVEDCIEGGLYRIWSRNLNFGVYRAKNHGFIGIREKFYNLYLFEEFHWDNGPPFGTVKPNELLEMCPISPLNENNEELFKWLTEKGKQYI